MQTSLYPPLLPYEGELLLWINAHHNPTLDAFMYMISNTGAWLPLVAVLLYYIFAKKPWQEALLLVLAIALCVAIGDQLSSSFAKPYFARYRPTHAPEFKEMLHVVYNYVGYPYGFFSGHSCNFFGAATVLALAVRRVWHSVMLYTLVILVVYSRMYLGVHFFSDVLVGMLVGVSIGCGVHYLREWLRRRYSPMGHLSSREVFSPNYRLWMGALIAFLPVLISYSIQVAKIIKRL